ncbi:MAG: phage head spike fiber domain-containing protein [Candidatus Thorarchaeota archaeon]|jgi:hypothetical protein
MSVRADTAIEMLFSPDQKSADSALLYLPFDTDVVSAASAATAPSTCSGGIIFPSHITPQVGAGAVQLAEATTNLHINPSAETDAAGWSAYQSTLTQSSDYAKVGSYSFKNTITVASGAFGQYHAFVTGAPISVTTYTSSAWVWVSADVASRCFFRSYLAMIGGASPINYNLYTDTVLVAGWNRVGTTATVDEADRTSVQAIYYLRDASTGDSFYIDGIQVEEKAYPTPYCDGSLGDGHTWSGTAHASTSSRTATSLIYDTADAGIEESGGTFGTWFSLPEMASGNHNRIFRWWDLWNTNSLYMNIGTAGTVDAVIYAGSTVQAVLSYDISSESAFSQHSVMITWKANELTLYVDGIQRVQDTSCTMPSIASTDFVIGEGGGGQALNGWLDETIVLDCVLTATEAAFWHNSGLAARSFLTEGGVWSDISSDTIKQLRAAYGVMNTGPLDRVAGAGTLSFEMRNDDLNSGSALGYYSPDHDNARSGFDTGIDVRLKMTYSGSTRYKWVGRIDTIKPLPGKYNQRRTKINAVDWFDVAAKTKVNLQGIQFNVSADTGLASLLTAMSNLPTASTLAAGQDSFPTIFDSSRDESTAVTTEMARLVLSELGYLYLKGNETTGGELIFEDRHTRAKYGAAAASMGNTCLTTFDVDRSAKNIFNKVKAEVNPREFDASASVLFTLQSTPLVAQSGSIIIEGRYTDPVQRGTLRIGGASMIDSASNTDYQMWTASDATGTDLTANFTVTTCYGGNTVRYEISNDGGQAGYITLLQARGRAIAVREPSISEKIDQVSIDTYGESVLRLNMPYQEDALVADDAATAMLSAWKDPVSIGKKVSFIGNLSDDLMKYGLWYEPGDKITIVEEVTGVDIEYFINGVELSVTEDGLIKFTWILTPAGLVSYWIIGVVGASEMGQTTTLGY